MSKYSKQEILDRMLAANSWKELQIGIKDVYEAFSEDAGGGSDKAETVSSQVKELQDKVSRLMDTNKQLRAENKALRNGNA